MTKIIHKECWQFVFGRFTTSPYSEYKTIKSRILIIVSSIFQNVFQNKSTPCWKKICQLRAYDERDYWQYQSLVQSLLLFHYYVFTMASLTRHFLLKCLCLCHENQQSCVRLSILHLYMILLLDFGTIPTVWYFQFVLLCR